MAAHTNGTAADVETTPASTIRQGRVEGFPQLLPESGYTVYIRHLEPEALIEAGELPDLLSPVIESMVYEGIDHEKLETALIDALKPGNFTPEKTRTLIRYINLMCMAALVKPRMVDAPKADDEIAPADIPLADRFFLWSMSLQPVEVLRRFRFDPGKAVALEPVLDDDEDRAEAEQSNRGA